MLRLVGTAERHLRRLRATAEIKDELLGASTEHCTWLAPVSDNPLAFGRLQFEPGTSKPAGHQLGHASEAGPQGCVEL
jgi:hypothetical protein